MNILAPLLITCENIYSAELKQCGIPRKILNIMIIVLDPKVFWKGNKHENEDNNDRDTGDDGGNDDDYNLTRNVIDNGTQN